MKRWLCVRAEFERAPDDWSVIHCAFEAEGCGGTVESDFPPAMSAYVFEDSHSEEKVKRLSHALTSLGAHNIEVQPVAEEDWAENWKQFFKPRQIGKQFWVIPSWDQSAEAHSDRHHSIILDPGQAFGTGDHATTRLALVNIERYVRPGMCVLDLGAGSGILSIAAAKLGAKVIATEIDDVAAEVARNNFARNGVEVRLEQTGEVPTANGSAELVVSNIFTAVLIRLLPGIANALKPGGLWIATGVIVENLRDLQDAAKRNGFIQEKTETDEGWVLAVFKKG